MNYIIEKFDSVTSMINKIAIRGNNTVMKYASSSCEKGSTRWNGTESYEQAVEFATRGYDKPLDALKRGVVKAEAKSTSARKCRSVNDVVGYVPNVPNAVIGIPQSMIRQDVERKKSKIVTITYAPTQNSGTYAETIEKAGVAVLTIVENLERSGYRVALNIMANFARDYNDVTMAMAKVKDWRQPLDLKKIAFPICNAGMQRRLGFKWLETCEGLKSNDWCHGYGRSVMGYDEAKKLLEEAKQLSDTEFFVNVEICSENNFDPDRIAKACGIILK